MHRSRELCQSSIRAFSGQGGEVIDKRPNTVIGKTVFEMVNHGFTPG